MIISDDLDSTVNPSDDFAEYVNGKWKINNPIPNKYTKWGTFELLHEDNLKKLLETGNPIDVVQTDNIRQILKKIIG